MVLVYTGSVSKTTFVLLFAVWRFLADLVMLMTAWFGRMMSCSSPNPVNDPAALVDAAMHQCLGCGGHCEALLVPSVSLEIAMAPCVSCCTVREGLSAGQAVQESS